MLSEPAPPLSSIRSGLGEGWDQLIARLLAADPNERPASARELLREVIRLSAGAETPAEVDLGVPYPEGDPLAGIFVGRRLRAQRAARRAGSACGRSDGPSRRWCWSARPDPAGARCSTWSRARSRWRRGRNHARRAVLAGDLRRADDMAAAAGPGIAAGRRRSAARRRGAAGGALRGAGNARPGTAAVHLAG
jgi:hypothetical protein